MHARALLTARSVLAPRLEVGAAEADAALRKLGQQRRRRRRVPAPRVDAQDRAPRRLAGQREHLRAAGVELG